MGSLQSGTWVVKNALAGYSSMAKKRKKKVKQKNPVARVLNKVNKNAVHKDKTKYNRKKKLKEDV